MTAQEFRPPKFAAVRHERIAALVANRGSIHLDELAAAFDVSHPTMRKDLTFLEQQGLLKRTHGGAVSIRAPGERDLMMRSVQNIEAKRAVGLACCDLVEDGEAIFLDCGTTMHSLRAAVGDAGFAANSAHELTKHRRMFGGRWWNNSHRARRTDTPKERWHFRATRFGDRQSILDCNCVYRRERDHRRGDHRGGL